MATALDAYGELTALKYKCKLDVKFQTDDSSSTTLRATDGTGDKVLTIPALSSNANMLTSESSIAGDKVNINGTGAEASLADADEFLFYDATASANKKVTGANLKTYVGAGSGVPSGSNNQIITYSNTTAQAVAMSGDITIQANGTTAVGANKISTAMLQDNSVSAVKIASSAIINDKVSASANIAYSKLNLSNSIVAGDLSSGSVVAAALATDAVTTVKVQANAITDAKISSLQGVTAGTVAASKLCLVDANKDLSGFRNLTSTGDAQSASVLVGTSEWKIVNSGQNLLFQKWNGGSSSWVTKFTMDGS
tara:strand:+ start:1624 stop:2553 length:930 start_codon:yes stop_codon:yes gene_type:complete